MSTEEWLKDQCNLHANGICMTRACLIRGGWDRTGSPDYKKATCEANECLKEIQGLESKIEELQLKLCPHPKP